MARRHRWRWLRDTWEKVPADREPAARYSRDTHRSFWHGGRAKVTGKVSPETGEQGSTMIDDEPLTKRGRISPKLAEMMANATPEQREKAIEIASKLLGCRAFREATGQTDLTKPFDPHAKVIPAAIEQAPKSQAQQSAAEHSIAGKLKMLPSAFDQMVSEGSTAWVAVTKNGPVRD